MIIDTATYDKDEKYLHELLTEAGLKRVAICCSTPVSSMSGNLMISSTVPGAPRATARCGPTRCTARDVDYIVRRQDRAQYRFVDVAV